MRTSNRPITPAPTRMRSAGTPPSFRTPTQISTKRASRNAKTGLSRTPVAIIHQAQVGRVSMVWCPLSGYRGPCITDKVGYLLPTRREFSAGLLRAGWTSTRGLPWQRASPTDFSGVPRPQPTRSRAPSERTGAGHRSGILSAISPAKFSVTTPAMSPATIITAGPRTSRSCASSASAPTACRPRGRASCPRAEADRTPRAWNFTTGSSMP